MSQLLAKYANFLNTPTDNLAVGDDFQDLIDWSFAPESSSSFTYDGQGALQTMTIYKSATQTTANRRLLYSLTYDGNGRVATEQINIYNFLDGATLEKATTFTFSYNANDEITNITQATV